MKWGCERVSLSAGAFAVMGPGALELSRLLGGCDATLVYARPCVCACPVRPAGLRFFHLLFIFFLSLFFLSSVWNFGEAAQAKFS